LDFGCEFELDSHEHNHTILFRDAQKRSLCPWAVYVLNLHGNSRMREVPPPGVEGD